MTFTKLTLGEPRLRGKVMGDPPNPCTRTVSTGSNLVRTLDQEFAITGGGPQGDEVPFTSPFPAFPVDEFSDPNSNWLWPNEPAKAVPDDGSSWPYDVAASEDLILQINYALEAGGWRYSTANPHSGTRHLRGYISNLGIGSDRTGRIQCSFWGCSPEFEGTWTYWIVPTGAVITLSVWIAISSLSGSPQAHLAIRDFDTNHQEFLPLTSTSYTKYETSIMVGAQGWLGGTSVQVIDGTGGAEVDYDDFTVSVVP